MSIRTFFINMLVLFTLTASAAWLIQGWRFEAKIARIESAHAQATREAEQAARAIEQQRIEDIDHVRNQAQTQIDTLRADVARADGIAVRLRTELANLRARESARHTATAERSPSQPDSAAVDLLTGMLERMEQNARAIAGYADELRIAALACEASYEAIR